MLGESTAPYVFLVILGIVFLCVLSVIIKYFSLWVQGYTTGAGIGFLELIEMSLRKVNGAVIVRAKIMAVKAGLDVGTDELEAHYLAGGNVPGVVRASIVANRTGHEFTFDELGTLDLARGDLDALAQAMAAAERGNYRVMLDPAVEGGFVKGAASGVAPEDLSGSRGITKDLARAHGTVIIDGIEHPGVFEEVYVPEGQPVEVVGVEGGSLVLREIRESDSDETEG